MKGDSTGPHRIFYLPFFSLYPTSPALFLIQSTQHNHKMLLQVEHLEVLISLSRYSFHDTLTKLLFFSFHQVYSSSAFLKTKKESSNHTEIYSLFGFVRGASEGYDHQESS